VRLSRLFYLPGFRERYSRLRYWLFTYYKDLNTSQDIASTSRISYSKENLGMYRSLRERVDFLVSWVGFTVRDFEKNILVVGPRFETELFGYQSLGFKRDRIFAVDTFSYSKRISLGNMHNLRYANETMQFVVCGWVIAYSSDVKKAISELSRVLRIGGLLFLTFDVENGITPISYWDAIASSYEDGPISSLLQSEFELYSQFIGKTSWSSEKDIVALVLKKKNP